MVEPTVVNITIELGILHFLIGVIGLSTVLMLGSLGKRLAVIGIALRGIEMAANRKKS